MLKLFCGLRCAYWSLCVYSHKTTKIIQIVKDILLCVLVPFCYYRCNCNFELANQRYSVPHTRLHFIPTNHLVCKSGSRTPYLLMYLSESWMLTIRVWLGLWALEYRLKIYTAKSEHSCFSSYVCICAVFLLSDSTSSNYFQKTNKQLPSKFSCYTTAPQAKPQHARVDIFSGRKLTAGYIKYIEDVKRNGHSHMECRLLYSVFYLW